eukprot:scaffold406_cov391-Prasinococcus_capsulatus_cf.AAC.7
MVNCRAVIACARCCLLRPSSRMYCLLRSFSASIFSMRLALSSARSSSSSSSGMRASASRTLSSGAAAAPQTSSSRRAFAWASPAAHATVILLELATALVTALPCCCAFATIEGRAFSVTWVATVAILPRSLSGDNCALCGGGLGGQWCCCCGLLRSTRPPTYTHAAHPPTAASTRASPHARARRGTERRRVRCCSLPAHGLTSHDPERACASWAAG